MTTDEKLKVLELAGYDYYYLTVCYAEAETFEDYISIIDYAYADYLKGEL
jgi:hypothetical protein